MAADGESKKLNDLNATDAQLDKRDTKKTVLKTETPSSDKTVHTQVADKIENCVEMNTDIGKDENTGADSPLNLSIGEDEDSFLNSGEDKPGRSGDTSKKDEDAKTAASAIGSTVKPQDKTTKGKEHDKDDHKKDMSNPAKDHIKDNPKKEENRAQKLSDHVKNEEDYSQPVASKTTSSTNKDDASEKEIAKNEIEKDANAKSQLGRSLWIINLLPSTKAAELKHLLSQYGKVIGAKVVQSSRNPNQRCYGYVTMETRSDADLCIEKLNNTELKGQIIRVTKVRPEHSLPVKTLQKKFDSDEKNKKTKSPPKQIKSNSPDKSSSDKKKSSTTSNIEKKTDDSKKDAKDSDRSEDNTDILNLDQIRGERRQRQIQRERAMRDDEKHRREMQRFRVFEKRQREESYRLEREREKIRIERERLERQRVEIMRLERDRQRLEREKLELEKQELRRQKIRLEETTRPEKRPSSTATSDYRTKRLASDRLYEETSTPPPRFQVSARESPVDITSKKEISKVYKSLIAYTKRSEEYAKLSSELKRSEYSGNELHSSSGRSSHMVHSISGSSSNPAVSSSKYESLSYLNKNRERPIRESARRPPLIPNVPTTTVAKDARYNATARDSPIPYREVRDVKEHRSLTKSDVRSSSRDHRYREPSPPTIKDGSRFRENNLWHSTTSSVKPLFTGMGTSTNSPRESWNKSSNNWRPAESSSNERWPSGSSRTLLPSLSSVQSSLYSGGNTSISAGISCPPPPGNSTYSMDRFDNYKSLNSSRKY